MNRLIARGAIGAVVPLVAVFALGVGSWSAAPRADAAAGKVRAFQIQGTATAHECKIPRTAAGTTRTDLCFTVDLFEYVGGKRRLVGTATDALADVKQVGDGLALTGTTFFNLPEGTLVTRGGTTVQPVTINSPSVTHITGAIPNMGENNVLDGTGAFKDARASLRLAGAVNTSNFANNQISFDCLFVVTFR